MPAKYPHSIKPELVQIGDEIEVTLPKVDGVVHSLKGVVGKRLDHGAVRYLLTDEGYTLLAWEPGKSGVKVMIHSRKPILQQTLFEPDFIRAVKDRLDENVA